ncbi:MAG TPA: aldehyde dehydrogenase family protein, partial [Streptosporangiaceae bacterium]|nr:aldehyde dehydrogenase family protein [Streptosporangiaceae bacterium]
DVLYKLYATNQVVILKPSPVVAAMTPVLRRVFAPFIERGFVRIVDGGVTVGRYLADHPKVGSVHLTGSAATHDAIVFGEGEDGARRTAGGRPRLTKPVTSELGGVSPTIVLPGRWKDADLRYQAEHVASQKLINNGFACVASQVLVLPQEWPQADRFLEQLDQVLATANSCPAYYPGADRRQERALAAHASARRYPGLRALVPDLDPGDLTDPLLNSEVFGPVLGVVRLPGHDARMFLGEAVSFANDVVPGTLGANLIGDPASLKGLGPELDRMISRLRFGCVGVNSWTAVAYLTPRAPWGGFPGAPLDDVQSGIGIVHNALLLDATERSVVYGPFRPTPRSLLAGELSLSPKPPWFVTNRTARTTGQLLTRFAADPGWRHVPAIVASAIRG